MRRFLQVSAYFALLFFGGARAALAVCPVCVVGVGAGLWISEELGIDDAIIGLWIGGFTVSLAMWNMVWFEKKGIRFFARDFLTALAYFIVLVLPLPFFFREIIGNPNHLLWGVDKLLLGIAVGSIGFYIGALGYQRIKVRRGRAHFPFQKVMMPLLPLVVLSVIFYYITL
jgi:hypothetical protein